MRLFVSVATVLALQLSYATHSDATLIAVDSNKANVSEGVRVISDLPAWEHGHSAWTADGRRLLYLGKAPVWGPVMLLDLAEPQKPRQVTSQMAGDVDWSPDHTRIAYTTNRLENGRTVETIHVKPLDLQESVDVLPGDLAVKSVSTSKEIHRWFEDDVLAYHEHLGTGVQQLFLLNTKRRTVHTDKELLATSFVWDETGQRVAGQWSGGPARFWLWDRQQRKFITPNKPLPGAAQWFETWSPDGRSALFTAWDKAASYGEPGAKSTLYRLNVETGQIEKIADQGGLATWAGDLIAYVRLQDRLTLVLTHEDGRVQWTTDLGELAKVQQRLPWEYRPTIAVSFVGYRTAADEWRVSPVKKKDSHLLFRGPATASNWSPFGRYLAVHRPVADNVHLQVLENPLTPGNPVPIEDAVRIAHAAAKRWRPKVELLRGFSQQTYEEREAQPPAGVDGRRRGWAFEFVDPITQEFVIVGTGDGKVTGVQLAGTDTSRGCDPTDIRVTGKWLADKAREADILPGTSGNAGYMFDVRYEHNRQQCAVTLIGANKQGRGKSLTVDPKTGAILYGG